MRAFIKIQRFFVIFFGIAISSCATYQHKIQDGLDKLKTDRREDAVDHFHKLAKESENTKDELAYLLDYATVLQLVGRYQESAQLFIKADRLSDQLDYVSVTQVTQATLGGEESVAYKASSFEKLMINGLNALNFLALGNLESAMVEVRRINDKIKILQREIRPNYQYNPFSTYLSGLIYESQDLWDDAYLAYLQTYRLGLNKNILLKDLRRAAIKARREEQLRKEGLWDETTSKQLKQGDCWIKKSCGMVTIIFLRGLGPQKKPLSENPQIPHLYPRKNLVNFFRVTVSSNDQASSGESNMNTDRVNDYMGEEIYNVTNVAIETLLADRNALQMRRLGARIAKHVVASKIEEKNKGLGALALLIMLISDRADLRQWSLLPDAIDFLKIPLPPGEWILRAEGLDELRQKVVEFSQDVIRIQSNRMVFKVIRSYK